MILYIKNPKDFTRKLLDLINEHSKVAGYKIGAQKPYTLTSLYINNEKTEREIKDFFGRNDAKAETPVLWPPHAKS